jgi:8-oxo-dGTP pyrophosphatase MutT (NUDIX family)
MHKPRSLSAASANNSRPPGAGRASAYPDLVQPPVAARRLAYRAAYRTLQVSWLVRRPDKRGVKCLLVHGDRILLVRHTYGDRRWDLPGGAMKRREDPLSAAQREMHEELGIESARWAGLGMVQGIFHHRRDTIYAFRADLETPALELDLGELQTASWFSTSDLPPKLAPYVLPILSRVG